MKIKTKTISIDEALAIEYPKRKKIKRPGLLFPTLIRLLSIPDLLATKFKYKKERMDEAGKGPWLILMNHSSFIDLKIASKLLYPKRYLIISTSDGFIGKPWLMRQIGCIPTQKFTTDISLAKDMLCAIQKKNTSVLMYPEASYSFDGTATPLPKALGAIAKKLGVPVVTIITDGAFLRQPLYNDLRLRKTNISATMKCLFTADEVKKKSVDELNAALEKEFSFDHFKRQYETKTVVDRNDRAEGLHRVLYRCPHCLAEGKTVSKGITLTCNACGKSYEMDIYGRLNATEGETEFPHIPDWYAWQRACVKQELIDDKYKLDQEVDICIMADYKAVYKVGKGRLIHDKSGFKLTSDDGKISYEQSPLSSYGLYSDFNWYELGDIICIGDKRRLYYCFPKGNVVTKARLAAEELYKLLKNGMNK